MTTLAPLTVEKFTAFFEQAVSGYAADNVAAGRWLEQDALEMARKESEQLMPQGVETPGHFFFAIRPEGQEQLVGYLWLASMQRGSVKVAYVYQVIVLPAHRRRGYARQALLDAEVVARELGHASMVLNVFASNPGARSLYESLGYAVTNMNMTKPLVGTP